MKESDSEKITRLEAENYALKLGLATWDAHFSRYDSWFSNGVDCREWPNDVMRRYKICNKATEHLWHSKLLKTSAS